MKPLENLMNIEKARLLHELFAQEIPALLKYTHNMCLTMQQNEQLTREQYKKGVFTDEVWLSFVEEIKSKIDKYGKRLHTHSRLFADQLFDGYVAFYMVHCMALYTTVRKHANHKFALAIELLFNP